MLLTVNHKEIENCKIQIDVEIPYSELEIEYETAKKEVIKEVALPGFRKGKAPVAVIEKRYGKYIEGRVLENIVPKAYEKAVEGKNLKTFGQPIAEEVSEFVKDAPLKVKYVVDKMAECTIENFKGLELVSDEISVTDADVDAEIKQTLRSKASIETSDDKVTAKGHYIKFSATFTDEAFSSYSLKEYPVELTETSPKPLELDNELEGLKLGDTKKFKKTFSDSFRIEELKGKKTEIEISILEIKQLKYPELTDELAIEFKYESVADMKAKIKKNLDNFVENYIKTNTRKTLLDQLKEKAKFQIPESLVEYSASRYLYQFKQQFGGNEEIFNSYMSSLKMTPESMIETYKETAKGNIQDELLTEEIIKINNIDATEEELNKESDKYAALQNQDPSEFKAMLQKQGQWEQLKHQIVVDKAIDWLNGQAKQKKGKKVTVSEIQQRG